MLSQYILQSYAFTILKYYSLFWVKPLFIKKNTNAMQEKYGKKNAKS